MTHEKAITNPSEGSSGSKTFAKLHGVNREKALLPFDHRCVMVFGPFAYADECADSYSSALIWNEINRRRFLIEKGDDEFSFSIPAVGAPDVANCILLLMTMACRKGLLAVFEIGTANSWVSLIVLPESHLRVEGTSVALRK